MNPLNTIERRGMTAISTPAGRVLIVAADHPAVEVERVLEGRHDQVVLGVEDAEDGALGDAGRLGDLPGGDGAPVLQEQGQRDVHQRTAALVGRHGGGTRGHPHDAR